MVHTVRLVLQDAFAYVLFGVVAIGVIGALVSFFYNRDAYDSIGRGGFFVDEDAARRGPGGPPLNVGERDEEIRQMLTARNARRVAAGREPVDVEEELARLIAPSIDAQLREEIRDHVVARNARRIRRGQEPFDVDAEVERQISDLAG